MNYFAIELGSYQVRLAHDQISLTEPIVVSQQFLTWICHYQQQWVIGDCVKDCLERSTYIEIYYDFLRDIEDKKSDSFISNDELNQKIFKHIVEIQPYIKKAKTIVAVVPAYLTESKKQALNLLAQDTGIILAGMISSAYAKALYLVSQTDFKVGDIFAVYEWGTSQFEFAIFTVTKIGHDCRINCIAQTHFDRGSYQWNQQLWNNVAKKYQDKRGKALKINQLHILDPQIHGTRLSFNNYAERAIQVWGGLVFSVARKEFEQSIQVDIDRSIQCIQQALIAANLSKQQMNKIYLTGANSQSSFVQKALQACFEHHQVVVQSETDLAAKGAVIYAQYAEVQKKAVKLKEIHQRNEEIITKANDDIQRTNTEKPKIIENTLDKSLVFIDDSKKFKPLKIIVWILCLAIVVVIIGYGLLNIKNQNNQIVFSDQCNHLGNSTASILIDQNINFSTQQRNYIVEHIWGEIDNNQSVGALIEIYKINENIDHLTSIKFCKPAQDSIYYKNFKQKIEQEVDKVFITPQTAERNIAENIQMIMNTREVKRSTYRTLMVFSDLAQHSQYASVNECQNPESTIQQFKMNIQRKAARPRLNNTRIELYVTENQEKSIQEQPCWHQFWLWFLGDIHGDSKLVKRNF